MPKRTDIKKILIIGSGPIVIGQACEFDYSGAQACKALREEGYRVILVNSNPATIMTDPGVADAIYLEPLTVASVERILELERPDGMLPGIGKAKSQLAGIDDKIIKRQHAIIMSMTKKERTNPKIINGKRRELRIVGTALSPEFVYALGPGALMADDKRFGILWMEHETLAAAHDLKGAFNSVSLDLERGANTGQVLQQVDRLHLEVLQTPIHPRVQVLAAVALRRLGGQASPGLELRRIAR